MSIGVIEMEYIYILANFVKQSTLEDKQERNKKMKRYKVSVNEIKTTVFELSANSKKEAEKMVKDIIYNSCILDLRYVTHNIKYNFMINKVKK